ncbi:hypothetical protein BC351_10720 [Paenibacillus ferrarius]|uniref:Uncharacterized protein n=1 Tax=Paenibacillus ferrarius TaxID=1469647 RepID=A0A1V4H8W2_9BACL|nr:hypothetical protein [Paenibacillus ferrarius]OPH47654.1 hypothetical protein BC351_10720 [Paenibacillus ferrarius]
MSEELKRLISNPNLSPAEKQKLILEITAQQENAEQEEKDFDRNYKNQVLSLLQSIDDKLSVLIKQIDRKLI